MHRLFIYTSTVSFLCFLLLSHSWAIQAEDKVVNLLHEPIYAELVETPTAALPAWRKHIDKKPTLVILSNNPFLQQIPPGLKKAAMTLTLTGTAKEIDSKAVYPSANPTLMPTMAVSAALQAGLFSKVVWVLPTPPTKPMASPATLKRQLLASGDISKEEASTLKRVEQNVSGHFRNTLWKICRINTLPEIEGPIILHIDLSHFSTTYQNEIKTPLYSMLAAVGNQIREMNWKALAATVSTSNISGHIHLRTRFLGQDISHC